MAKPGVAMDVEHVLHMKEGLGDTSYAQNSSLQKKTMQTLRHMIVKAAVEVCESLVSENMIMADLGCASGPNSLSLVGDIIKAVRQRSGEAARPVPEFMVFLNDLPSNDFNAIFASFPEFMERIGVDAGAQLFLAGVPGNFYGRLFGKAYLHFIFSCYSLHWLSRVPLGLYNDEGKSMNKGKAYISETSPPIVTTAYFKQFQMDFNLFLKSRSAELQSSGKMALLLLGRRIQGHQDMATNFFWNMLDKSFSILVSHGVVEEDKVDSYNVPFYAPSAKEVENEVEREGSFAIEHIEVCEFSSSSGDAEKDVRAAAMAIRAIQESMIKHHFGEQIIDPLFKVFTELLTEARAKAEIKGVHLIIILKKSA
ncbi:SAM dependent carboxyl methyltransferase protein [Dioscorea alata]|uniref:SAM dependent carboxyl methyltransferase protein n=1 Tax=Dioscorea alata TaxID=55571 RepID=A0ACB7W5S0_DIOAL|nr:SAM dependent carboxyl methyltransferase protein [Dioscorea alata]